MVKPARNTRRQIINCELAHLNHEPENAGERPAFGSIEPRGVHLNHTWRAKGLD